MTEGGGESGDAGREDRDIIGMGIRIGEIGVVDREGKGERGKEEDVR